MFHPIKFFITLNIIVPLCFAAITENKNGSNIEFKSDNGINMTRMEFVNNMTEDWIASTLQSQNIDISKNNSKNAHAPNVSRNYYSVNNIKVEKHCVSTKDGIACIEVRYMKDPMKHYPIWTRVRRDTSADDYPDSEILSEEDGDEDGEKEIKRAPSKISFKRNDAPDNIRNSSYHRDLTKNNSETGINKRNLNRRYQNEDEFRMGGDEWDEYDDSSEKEGNIRPQGRSHDFQAEQGEEEYDDSRGIEDDIKPQGISHDYQAEQDDEEEEDDNYRRPAPEDSDFAAEPREEDYGEDGDYSDRLEERSFDSSGKVKSGEPVLKGSDKGKKHENDEEYGNDDKEDYQSVKRKYGKKHGNDKGKNKKNHGDAERKHNGKYGGDEELWPSKSDDSFDYSKENEGDVPPEWNRCKLPPPQNTFEALCKTSPNEVKCNLYCIFGHTFEEGIVRKTTCSFQTGQWTERFDECKPFADCNLKLTTAGTLNCKTNTVKESTKCTISCERYLSNDSSEAKIYECETSGRWNPPLPHCVMREGIDIVEMPEEHQHKEIKYP